ncbi:MAG TPA: IPT/TIG domain-containing protein, partial [Planctomycetaceae bacterium]|nr:IPT/TIG domain-containing protein [Planctomycetaceae bacterium]
MVRTGWSRLARRAFISLVNRFHELHGTARDRRRGRRLRRRDFACYTVAAEVLEVRQLLSAAITAVSPNSGQQTGGTSVTITGSGFSSVTGVTFGGFAATSYTVTSSSAITAVSPSHGVGMVDIQVMAMMGNSSIVTADQFTYLQSRPTVTGVGPTSGGAAGGTSVTITGINFTG